MADEKLNMSTLHIVAQKANHILGRIKRNVASRPGEVIHPHYSSCAVCLSSAAVHLANRTCETTTSKATHQNKACVLVTSVPHFSLPHNCLCFAVVKRQKREECSCSCTYRGEYSLKIYFVSQAREARL